jgi:hypothetical protein
MILENYNMPCHAMHPMQDLFWKVFHMHSKLVCNLYALLCWQNFIFVKKWVLQYETLIIPCPNFDPIY